MVFNLDLAVGWLSAQNSLAVALAGSQRRPVTSGGSTPAEIAGNALAILNLEGVAVGTPASVSELVLGVGAFTTVVPVEATDMFAGPAAPGLAPDGVATGQLAAANFAQVW